MSKIARILSIFLLVFAPVLIAQEGPLVLDHADHFEVVYETGRYVTYVTGNVRFHRDKTKIECDSAVWRKGENVHLSGNVYVDDSDFMLQADSVFLDLETEESLARGKRVELWSYPDSIYAVGTHAFYNKQLRYFQMLERPLLYLRYPDTANMIEILADTVTYDARNKLADAQGTVLLSTGELSSSSGKAYMDGNANTLLLQDQPSAKRGNSDIKGDTIIVKMASEMLEQIDVIDSAQGEFSEIVDSALGYTDKSVLRGKKITMLFQDGKMSRINTYEQAYSWYYPSSRGSLDYNENSISGDTIRFTIENERLEKVDVHGGAVGTFVTGRLGSSDSVIAPVRDTIDYQATTIHYAVRDSVITLQEAATVTQQTMSLQAHRVSLNTQTRIVEAYSAQLPDSIDDAPYSVAGELQPNAIPVVLKDGDQELFGDYLKYSFDTKKGQIVQSKSGFDQGFYYGDKSFRETEDIFYVNDGCYTTCDQDEPHFHFYSKDMKLIKDDKLIARPVVLYIERIPIIYLPFYVFPIKKGRHSGILPFSFGKFERGDRWVRNVGYYWAASDYWDWQGAFDYLEQEQNFIFKSRVNWAQIYKMSGNLSVSYTRTTLFNSAVAREGKSTRWTINGDHRHEVTPSFSIAATGTYQSDDTYYQDYSSNLEDRLNRELKSEVSFSKKFGQRTSLAGRFTHYEKLDIKERTDNLPYVSLSLPTVYPFGSGTRDESGRLQQSVLQKLSLRYTPNLQNVSNRQTDETVVDVGEDTVIVVDTLGVADTTITALEDTVFTRTRKHYTKINHNPSLNLPTFNIFKYFIFNPSIRYSETWIKIIETDQSIDDSIDASKVYRTYSASAGASLKTALYGTLYPRIFGVKALRHVFTPSISYGYSPEIDRHPEVRRFAGGGAGSAKSSSVSLSFQNLLQGKFGNDENATGIDLLSVTTSLSHNFENPKRPWSDVSTRIQSTAIKGLNISSQMNHSLYVPGTDDLSFWSPYLQNWSLRMSFNLRGQRFLFDDPAKNAKRTDSLGKGSAKPPAAPTNKPKGWNANLAYYFAESGRGTSYNKDSYLSISLNFHLTTNTAITYTQRYDIDRGITTNNSVSIKRQIHCWTGSLWWVPIGSNAGFGFKLFANAIPDLTLDNNYDSFANSLRY